LIHNQETTDQGPPDKHIYKENNQNPEISENEGTKKHLS
jgi:hypothetical protein